MQDEETARKFGELNLINEVVELPDGTIRVRFTPLSAYSPLAVNIGREIRAACLAVEGVKKVTVERNGHMQDELVNRLVNKEERRGK